MKILEDFEKSGATYDDLALALFKLKDNGIDEVVSLLLMHSGLGRLTDYAEAIEVIIRDYDHLEKWREEAGEIT